MAKIKSMGSLRNVIDAMIKEERKGTKEYRALAKIIVRSFGTSNTRATITRKLMDIAKDESKHSIMLRHIKSQIKKLW